MKVCCKPCDDNEMCCEAHSCCVECHCSYEEDVALPHIPEIEADQIRAEHRLLQARGFPRDEVIAHSEREMRIFRKYCPPEVLQQLDQDHSAYEAGILGLQPDEEPAMNNNQQVAVGATFYIGAQPGRQYSPGSEPSPIPPCEVRLTWFGLDPKVAEVIWKSQRFQYKANPYPYNAWKQSDPGQTLSEWYTNVLYWDFKDKVSLFPAGQLKPLKIDPKNPAHKSAVMFWTTLYECVHKNAPMDIQSNPRGGGGGHHGGGGRWRGGFGGGFYGYPYYGYGYPYYGYQQQQTRGGFDCVEFDNAGNCLVLKKRGADVDLSSLQGNPSTPPRTFAASVYPQQQFQAQPQGGKRGIDCPEGQYACELIPGTWVCYDKNTHCPGKISAGPQYGESQGMGPGTTFIKCPKGQIPTKDGKGCKFPPIELPKGDDPLSGLKGNPGPYMDCYAVCRDIGNTPEYCAESCKKRLGAYQPGSNFPAQTQRRRNPGSTAPGTFAASVAPQFQAQPQQSYPGYPQQQFQAQPQFQVDAECMAKCAKLGYDEAKCYRMCHKTGAPQLGAWPQSEFGPTGCEWVKQSDGTWKNSCEGKIAAGPQPGAASTCMTECIKNGYSVQACREYCRAGQPNSGPSSPQLGASGWRHLGRTADPEGKNRFCFWQQGPGNTVYLCCYDSVGGLKCYHSNPRLGTQSGQGQMVPVPVPAGLKCFEYRTQICCWSPNGGPPVCYPKVST